MKPTVHYCSFCGKSQHDVGALVNGPSVLICDECVDLCTDILRGMLIDRIEAVKTGGNEPEHAHGFPPICCSFCGKSCCDVDKLVVGRMYVFICDKCVELCAEQLESTEIGDSEPRAICSFCRKRQHDVCKLIKTQSADIYDGLPVFICDECVELYMDVIRAKSKRLLRGWLCR